MIVNRRIYDQMRGQSYILFCLCSSLYLEHTQALKLGGGHLKNKMVDTNYFFQKLPP